MVAAAYRNESLNRGRRRVAQPSRVGGTDGVERVGGLGSPDVHDVRAEHLQPIAEPRLCRSPSKRCVDEIPVDTFDLTVAEKQDHGLVSWNKEWVGRDRVKPAADISAV